MKEKSNIILNLKILRLILINVFKAVIYLNAISITEAFDAHKDLYIPRGRYNELFRFCV